MNKVLSLLLTAIMLLSALAVPVSADGQEITVVYNGEKMEFDVPPMIINSRTMVPMRAIFEALKATVYWSAQNETVVGVGLFGDRIVAPIGSKTATINGKPVEIDSPPALVNGRTLVPLRFVSEALDCEVAWDNDTRTVTISDKKTDADLLFFDISSYSTLGSWSDKGNHLLHGKYTEEPATSPEEDAVANFRVSENGTYRVWVRANDYATNQQGARFFNIDIDGKRLEKTFGQHGNDGFIWEDGGLIELSKAELHELRVVDTAGFYGRLKGIIITNDLELVPEGEFENYEQYVMENMSSGSVIPATFPEWANGEINETQVETIENDNYKINFYKGTTARGGIVQNEIFMKQDGKWELVKARTEDFGVLSLRANESVAATKVPSTATVGSIPFEIFEQSFDTFDEEYTSSSIKDYYNSGTPEWLIPSSLTKIDENTVQLGISSDNVEGTLTFSFDNLVKDPKVSFNVTLKTEGAYSFSHFSGNDFKDDSFEKVTAPVHYIQKTIPQDASVLGESAMFTPIIAFTFDNNGKTLTKGVAVDPTSVRQYVARPGDQDFGMIFRSPDGNARAQLVAPLFGTVQCTFNKNDNYSFAYRILYTEKDGYNTMKHVAEDMFNCVDLRENYYASLNDAIYNVTDLIKDDTYSAWNDKEMAFGYMESYYEGGNPCSQSDILELVQRYLLTEDEELLDERVIPSVAFMLTRGGNSYQRNGQDPKLLGSSSNFTASSYVGLYQASQGRTPYFLTDALQRYNTYKPQNGPVNSQSLNLLFETENYDSDITLIADIMLEKLYSENFVANAAFIHDTVNEMLNYFVRAYEETNEQRYLDGAEKVGEYIMQQIWTTGYQNDYATTAYTVDPEYLTNLYCHNSDAYFIGYWKDGVRWKVGNPVGVFTAAKDTQSKLKAESAPGWVAARTGEGMEHDCSSIMARSIYMNTWAGTMLRLAKYTGEDFFRTQARNTVIGKFANYPGYYHERLSLHDKQAAFPYEGPDFNMIYWHQIPSFLAMLEDFLINDFWDRSDMKIDFPSVVNSGYAYFDTNQFGFAPGKFYDEDNMWLWLDRGIVQPDDLRVNYLPAKKDGTLAVGFINTSDEALTTNVTLGEKIPNASSYSETATLLDKDGNKSTVEIVNGSFSLTIPAKGIVSVVMHPDVKKPSWVKDYAPSADLGSTVSAFDSGKAYLLQFNDNSYHVYMYSNKYGTEVSSVTYNYTVNGQNNSKTITEYPFETIVKVPIVSGLDRKFSYSVTAKDVNGKELDLGGGTLSPISAADAKEFDGNIPDVPLYTPISDFEPITVKLKSIATAQGKIRLTLANDDLKPLGKLENGSMAGLKIKAILTNKETGEKHLINRMILDNEVREQSTIITVNPYGAIDRTNATSEFYTFDTLLLMPKDANPADHKLKDEEKAVSKVPEQEKYELPSFEPFKVTPTSYGRNVDTWRLPIPYAQFSFPVSENMLGRVGVLLTVTEVSTGETKTYKTMVTANEMSTSTTVLVMDIPKDFPEAKLNFTNTDNYSFYEITLVPPTKLK